MNTYIEILDNFFEDLTKDNNDKNKEIMFLEITKFKLIEKIIAVDNRVFDDFKTGIINQKKISKTILDSFSYTLSYFEKSQINIKQKIEKQMLSLVIDGKKNITFYDKNNKEKSLECILSKNMAVVLWENSIVDENISEKTIILEVKKI
tara:strand:- start:264 stop:710 length:447 start_codon:yes stop_codon:yes gene_type:complete